MQKLDLIIFSSKLLIPIAEAVRENLKRDFNVTPWTEGFFHSNEIALNRFLKKLLCFDVAVVILGADDLRVDTTDATRKVSVPRDNVIFELGAAMSRLGTQKTFIICPEEPRVVLPSYFKGFDPLTYENRKDGNLDAAVGSACVAIKRRCKELDQQAYYSDLPAVGLSHGYFSNFVNPTYARLRGGNTLQFGGEWKPEYGFSLTIVMPDEFLNRDQVEQFFNKKWGVMKLQLDLKDGRNINVYALPRKSPDAPLRIFDIPTTLLTSETVIKRVDSFWGGADKAFREALQRREIASFARSIEERITENKQQGYVRVIDVAEAEKELGAKG